MDESLHFKYKEITRRYVCTLDDSNFNFYGNGLSTLHYFILSVWVSRSYWIGTGQLTFKYRRHERGVAEIDGRADEVAHIVDGLVAVYAALVEQRADQ